MIEFDFATLEHRLRELAFLNSGVTIILSDKRHAEERTETMRYEGGIEEFVKYLDRNKSPLENRLPSVPTMRSPMRLQIRPLEPIRARSHWSLSSV